MEHDDFANAQKAAQDLVRQLLGDVESRAVEVQHLIRLAGVNDEKLQQIADIAKHTKAELASIGMAVDRATLERAAQIADGLRAAAEQGQHRLDQISTAIHEALKRAGGD
ncbi:MAG: hypothetical protein ABSC56_09930 [Solirubrobacteraceae bacterium]|jgi:hypothetical protein